MKERPILFSGPMVRAILEGRKTQTRRIVKGAALEWLTDFTPEYVALPENHMCPHGYAGDRLWVRETWGYCDRGNVIYRADDIQSLAKERRWVSMPTWKPSIHMPRRLSRVSLEITDVRVERVQDISEEDAEAEGATPWQFGPEQPMTSGELGCEQPFRGGFACLWDEINEARGFTWFSNPWVWAVSFRKLEGEAG